MVTTCIQACPDRYFITLTTKRCYDRIVMSAEVSKMLHRVNSKLFGTEYTRRRRLRLATYAVQERTINQGLHTHLLVGVPEDSLSKKAIPCRWPVDGLIVNTWSTMDDHGRRDAKAQDARSIYDFSGVLGYVTKTVRTIEDIDHIDLLNTTFPEDR